MQPVLEVSLEERSADDGDVGSPTLSAFFRHLANDDDFDVSALISIDDQPLYACADSSDDSPAPAPAGYEHGGTAAVIWDDTGLASAPAGYVHGGAAAVACRYDDPGLAPAPAPAGHALGGAAAFDCANPNLVRISRGTRALATATSGAGYGAAAPPHCVSGPPDATNSSRVQPLHTARQRMRAPQLLNTYVASAGTAVLTATAEAAAPGAASSSAAGAAAAAGSHRLLRPRQSTPGGLTQQLDSQMQTRGGAAAAPNIAGDLLACDSIIKALGSSRAESLQRFVVPSTPFAAPTAGSSTQAQQQVPTGQPPPLRTSSLPRALRLPTLLPPAMVQEAGCEGGGAVGPPQQPPAAAAAAAAAHQGLAQARCAPPGLVRTPSKGVLGGSAAAAAAAAAAAGPLLTEPLSDFSARAGAVAAAAGSAPTGGAAHIRCSPCAAATPHPLGTSSVQWSHMDSSRRQLLHNSSNSSSDTLAQSSFCQQQHQQQQQFPGLHADGPFCSAAAGGGRAPAVSGWVLPQPLPATAPAADAGLPPLQPVHPPAAWLRGAAEGHSSMVDAAHLSGAVSGMAAEVAGELQPGAAATHVATLQSEAAAAVLSVAGAAVAALTAFTAGQAGAAAAVDTAARPRKRQKSQGVEVTAGTSGIYPHSIMSGQLSTLIAYLSDLQEQQEQLTRTAE